MGDYSLPGYYLLRDRIPLYFTLIYFNRHRFSKTVKTYFGLYLFILTYVLTSISFGLMIHQNPLTYLFGITWIYAGPITWGFYILTSTVLIARKRVPIFTSFYYSYITASAGGWLYEIPIFIKTTGLWSWIRVNNNNTFFLSYQIISVFLCIWLLKNNLNFKFSLLPTLGVALYLIYFVTCLPKAYLYYMIPNPDIYWKWFARLPTVISLLLVSEGIRK